MASVIISWTPAPNESTEQKVYYKLNTQSDTEWVLYATVSSTANEIQIDGLQPNVIYNFKVTNQCSDGSIAQSIPTSQIVFECPNVIVTPESRKLNFEIQILGGDVNKYEVALIRNGIVMGNPKVYVEPAANIVDSFTNLLPTTSYQIRVTIFAGAKYVYSSVCPVINTATTAPEACTPPTNVVATVVNT